MEDKWKAERIPADRKLRGEAYNRVAADVISSGIPGVITHLNEDLLETAKKSSRTAYAVVVESDDWMERVKKETDKAGNDPELLKKLVYRLLGSYQYATSLLRLKGLKIVNSFEEAMSDMPPVKSDDGKRSYKNSGTVASNLKGLSTLFESWPYDQGLDSLKAKVVEEAEELQEGGNEKPVRINKNEWEFIGTSAGSEAITGIIVNLKLLHMLGVDVNSSLRLAHQRHIEQYDRYHSS